MREQARSLAGKFDLDDADDSGDLGEAEKDISYRRKATNSVNMPVRQQKLAEDGGQATSKSPLAKDQFLNQFS